MAEDWGVKMTKEVVQPRVPEPVVAVGMLQPAGLWGSFGANQLSGLAGTLMRRAANKRAGGLAKSGAFSTKTALLAFTEARLYAFNAKPSGRSWKIVDEAGDWDRSDLTITATPGTLSTKVVVDVQSTGDHFELEATTAMGGDKFNRPFLDEIEKG
jgi:hypothetical protein